MALKRALSAQLRAFVLNAEAPAAMAAALVGAIMGVIGELYGDQAAAAVLYTLADATATRTRSSAGPEA